MPTPIPKERIAELILLGICQPAVLWFKAADRNYEDLAEHPSWAFAAACYPGGDVKLLQAIVIAHGSPKMRRQFAERVPGADKAALLAGL